MTSEPEGDATSPSFAREHGKYSQYSSLPKHANLAAKSGRCEPRERDCVGCELRTPACWCARWICNRECAPRLEKISGVTGDNAIDVAGARMSSMRYLSSRAVMSFGTSTASVTLSFAGMTCCKRLRRSRLLPTIGMMRTAARVAAFSLRLAIIFAASANARTS